VNLRGKQSKRWLGRTEILTRTLQSETIQSEQVGNGANQLIERNARSSPSAYRSVLQNVLDTSDIVRDGDLSTLIPMVRTATAARSFLC